MSEALQRDPSPDPLPDPCPGALSLAAARDGLLARVRIPGGALTPPQLRALAALAEVCGHGALDITGRANVQVRGLGGRVAERFGQGLRAAGLLPSDAHDRVRNIVASPLAGIDPDELLDPRPAVAALDAALLADDGMSLLPPKFGFVVDGGGLPVGAFAQDVGLVALPAGGAAGTAGVEWGLVIGGRDTGQRVQPDGLVTLALAAAHAFLAARASVGGTHTDVRRMRELVRDAAGHAAVLREIGRRCPGVRRSGAPLARRPEPTVGPLGVLRQRQAGLAVLSPVVALGRLSAAQATGLASLAAEHGGDLRLTPWRGIVLAGVSERALPDATERLQALGLPLTPADPFAGLVACAGPEGCAAGLADVRGDATALAQRLARRPRAPGAPPVVHWSGCGKRCAMRGPSDLLLVATGEGYELHVSGAPVQSRLNGASAVAAAAAVLAGEGAPARTAARSPHRAPGEST